MASQNTEAKTPAHNNEAEQAFLGALLLDNYVARDYSGNLEVEDFYLNSHKEIISAIQSLINRDNVTCDIITLTEELRKQKTLDKAGGPAYIAGLTSTTPSSANIEHYIRIIKDCSIKRKILRLSSEIYARSLDVSENASNLIEYCQSEIFRITGSHHIINYQSANSLMGRTIEFIEERKKLKGEYTGVETGIKKLDDLTLGLQKSDLIIIGARPSVGKTAFALQIASHIVAKLDIKERLSCAFFSLEMSSISLMIRMLAQLSKVSGKQLQSGMYKTSDSENITNAAARLYEAPLYLIDSPNMKLFDLRSTARKLKMLYDIKVIFIDYLTLISADNEKEGMPRWERFAGISSSLKSLARELEVPVVALSQLRREAEGKQPSLADLRESGTIEQDADLILLLHPVENRATDSHGFYSTRELELILAKQRNGPIGTISLVFKPNTGEFFEKEFEAKN